MRTNAPLLTLIILLAACTAQIDTANQPAKTGPLPREEPAPSHQPTINNTSKDLAYNDDEYQRWREQPNAVVLLVSDQHQAARTLLQEGQETTLPLNNPVTIRVKAVNDTHAQLTIDNRSESVQENSHAYNQDKSVTIQVTETITQG